MGLFNIFKSKDKKQEDTSKDKVKIEFTAEERDAINRKLEEFQSVVNESKSPDGEYYVHPKIIDAMTAQGLFEYVVQLVREAEGTDHSKHEFNAILDKAKKAQIKVYSIHDLPIYIFYLASIYEIAGELDKANHWFKFFLRVQDAHKPDEVDALHLDLLQKELGIDVKEAIEITRGKATGR